MEEFVSFPCFIVIVHERYAHTLNSLVWGSLRLAPITTQPQFYNYLPTVYGIYNTVEPFDPPTQNTINVIICMLYTDTHQQHTG